MSHDTQDNFSPLPPPPESLEARRGLMPPPPPIRRDPWRIALTVATLICAVAGIEYLTGDARLDALADGWTVGVSAWTATAASLSIVAVLLLSALPSQGLLVGATVEKRVDVFSWVALIICAGLGAGMIHWSVAEPLLHFQSPLPPLEDSAGSRTLASEALATTLLHWGVHYWAITALWTVVMARFGRPDIATADSPSVQTHWSRSFSHGFIVAVALIAQVAAAVVAVRHLAAPIDTALLNQGIDARLVTLTEVDGAIREELTANGLTLFSMMLLAAGWLICLGGPRFGLRLLGIGLGLAIATFMAVVLSRSGISANLDLVGGAFSEYTTGRVFSVIGARTLDDPDWYGLWTGYYSIWWFALAPLTALLIVSISRGRSARAMMLVTLIAGGGTSIIWTVIMSGAALVRELGDGDLASEVMLDLPRAALALSDLIVEPGHWLAPTTSIAALGALLLLARLTLTLHAVTWWSQRSARFPRAMVLGAWAGVLLLCIMLLGSPERLRTVESLVVIVAPLTLIALLAGLVRYIGTLILNPPTAEPNNDDQS